MISRIITFIYAMIISFLLAIAALIPFVLFNSSTSQGICTVVSKERSDVHLDNFIIDTMECGELNLSNRFLNPDFDAEVLYGKITPDNSYKFIVSGRYIPMLGIRPNIIDIFPV